MPSWETEALTTAASTLGGAIIGGTRRYIKNNKTTEILTLEKQLKTAKAALKQNPNDDKFVKEAANLKSQVKAAKKANNTRQNQLKIARDSAVGAGAGYVSAKLTWAGIKKFRVRPQNLENIASSVKKETTTLEAKAKPPKKAAASESPAKPSNETVAPAPKVELPSIKTRNGGFNEQSWSNGRFSLDTDFHVKSGTQWASYPAGTEVHLKAGDKVVAMNLKGVKYSVRASQTEQGLCLDDLEAEKAVKRIGTHLKGRPDPKAAIEANIIGERTNDPFAHLRANGTARRMGTHLKGRPDSKAAIEANIIGERADDPFAYLREQEQKGREANTAARRMGDHLKGRPDPKAAIETTIIGGRTDDPFAHLRTQEAKDTVHALEEKLAPPQGAQVRRTIRRQFNGFPDQPSKESVTLKNWMEECAANLEASYAKDFRKLPTRQIFEGGFEQRTSPNGLLSLSTDFHVRSGGKVTSHAANSVVQLKSGDKVFAMNNDGVRYKILASINEEGLRVTDLQCSPIAVPEVLTPKRAKLYMQRTGKKLKGRPDPKAAIEANIIGKSTDDPFAYLRTEEAKDTARRMGDHLKGRPDPKAAIEANIIGQRMDDPFAYLREQAARTQQAKDTVHALEEKLAPPQGAQVRRTIRRQFNGFPDQPSQELVSLRNWMEENAAKRQVREAARADARRLGTHLKGRPDPKAAIETNIIGQSTDDFAYLREQEQITQQARAAARRTGTHLKGRPDPQAVIEANIIGVHADDPFAYLKTQDAKDTVSALEEKLAPPQGAQVRRTIRRQFNGFPDQPSQELVSLRNWMEENASEMAATAPESAQTVSVHTLTVNRPETTQARVTIADASNVETTSAGNTTAGGWRSHLPKWLGGRRD